MKKKIIIFLVLCLALTGCDLLPLDLPFPGATATQNQVQPSETETSEPEEPSTPTPILTETALPTETTAPIATSTNTAVPFSLQADSPVYIQNFAHTDAACDWLGVAGQVFGEDGSPQINLVLIVSGTLGQTAIDMTGVTGIPEADIYGPGGYEIMLADAPVQSDDSLSIQVFDLQGNTLSEPVSFNTYSDCDKNLIVINFNAK